MTLSSVIICHHDARHRGPILPTSASRHEPLGIGQALLETVVLMFKLVQALLRNRVEQHSNHAVASIQQIELGGRRLLTEGLAAVEDFHVLLLRNRERGFTRFIGVHQGIGTIRRRHVFGEVVQHS